jgi:phosphatidylglycerol---prolipoprotein diacylglyceryl transferase
MFVLAFPQIDPVLVEIGPLAIRWYALAYIAGIVLGWRYAVRLAAKPPGLVPPASLDDFVLYVTLGIVLGGRLGYVLFYKPLYFLDNPLEIFVVWQGGMSFHGGALGVIVGILIFAWARRIPILALGDIVAAVVPIGLFLGRVANFINGELWGRVSDVPWAMAFPRGGPDPRHPSQLYQAALEGLCVFALLYALERAGLRRKPGVVAGAFLVGYGVARSIGEVFREPDAFLGFLIGGLTMGQALSAPMIIVGVVLILRGLRRGDVVVAA